MRGALATVKLMFTAARVQRWLLALGAAALAAALAGIATGVDSWWPPVLLVGGSIVVLFIPAFVMGMLLRQLAAPRVVRLIPHGRLQLFLGVMLTALLVAIGAALMAIALIKTTGPAPYAMHHPIEQVRANFVIALLVATAACLFFYYGSQSQFGALAPIACVAALRLLGSAFPHLFPHLRFSALPGDPHAEGIVLAGITVSWALFAGQFLRAGHIAPPVWGGSASASMDPNARPAPWLAGPADPDTELPFTQRKAMRTLLAGIHLGRRGRIRLMPRVVLVYGGVVLFLFWMGQGMGHGGTAVAATMIAFMGGIVGSTLALSMVRRARYLWLKAGLDRRQLFHVVETQAWRALLIIGAAVLVLIGLLCLLARQPPAIIARAGLLTLVPGAVFMYLCLLHTRGWLRFPDLLATVTCLALWLVGFVLSMSGTADPALLWLLGTEALLIPAFRTWAKARWRNIDWLVNRPQQLARPPAA